MVSNEMKEIIIKLRIEEGRSLQSLCDEFGVSRYSISRWVSEFRKEATFKKEKADSLMIMEYNRKLKQENEELKKEVDFLKKAAAFFAKESQ